MLQTWVWRSTSCLSLSCNILQCLISCCFNDIPTTAFIPTHRERIWNGTFLMCHWHNFYPCTNLDFRDKIICSRYWRVDCQSRISRSPVKYFFLYIIYRKWPLIVTCKYRWKTLYKCIHEMTDIWIYERIIYRKWPLIVTCIYRWKTLYKCIHAMTDMWIYETGTQEWP